MLIHNNTKICGNEAEKFYKENCGGDDKASCAYKVSIYYKLTLFGYI